MSNAWAIGLYSYSTPHPGPQGFKDFYDAVLAIFHAAGIEPTYFAAEGPGYRGELTKFGGRTNAKALKTEFSNINVVSLVANPSGSDKPSYDGFASASLSYTEALGETLLCLAVEDRILAFGSDIFEKTLQSLVLLQSWDFGYALPQSIEKNPEFHVLGLDDGGLKSEDIRRLNAWYASPPEVRLRRLRDVYPYVVLNVAQLQAPVSESRMLDDFVRSELSTTLKSIQGTPLWLWKIPLETLKNLREKLVGSEVLIA